MTELLQNTTSFIWIVLAIVVWVRLKQWDERFRKLYNEVNWMIINAQEERNALAHSDEHCER